MTTPLARRTLEIYITSYCFGCETAQALAALVQAHPLADVAVRVVDLSAPGTVRPPAVFAVPTYVLDGRVLSLGNPEPAWLLERLGIVADDPVEVS